MTRDLRENHELIAREDEPAGWPAEMTEVYYELSAETSHPPPGKARGKVESGDGVPEEMNQRKNYCSIFPFTDTQRT
jgi:hypothetical protein